VQTLAIVALFADGKTKIKNIGNLKFKESDRINDTAKELRKMRADVEIKDNELIISKSQLKPAVIDSHNDHRMAMSFAIAGLKIPGIKINNPECVNKSFPQFWQKLNELTESKEQKNIVLIGYRGAGKTSISNELSKLTGMKVTSTDGEIKKKVKMDLDVFIVKYGWKKFRDIEIEVVKNLENSNEIIIDCGGGVVENNDNIKSLKQNGVVFWLKAPVNVLAERIKDAGNRPSITGKKSFTEEIGEVLARRMPLYRKAADFEIDTADEKPIEAAKTIIELNKSQMKTQICAVITADNVKDALNDIKKAASADLIELRLDFIKNIDNSKIKSIIENSPKPVIATCRPVKFGGMFKGSEKDRLDLLRTVIDNGATFVDVEFQSGIVDKIINNTKSRIIISHHDFKETPSLGNLNSLCETTKKLNPDLIKIVTTANSINDNFRVFEFLNGKNNLISFCMGQKGEMSRILAPKFGSKHTYASLEKGKESAPGQITIEEIQNLYHVSLIGKDTNVIGIIGEFAENSMSKYMHNPNFVKNRANFVYISFKVLKNELNEFMENFRKFNFKGAAVTIPHKEGIIKYIDELDETAEHIGATNTLVNDNGKITGYNTDYYGAVHALREQIKIKNKKVLVLGAGGAARAVVYGLKKEGANITIVNRTNKKAQELADEFEVDFDKFNNMNNLIKNNEIIINATSAGMSPNEEQSVLSEKDLVKGKIVMDIVYKPINTKLIRLAKKKGCKIITGDRMLIYQAVRQFELWTGVNPGFEEMEKELMKQIKKE